MKRPSPPDAVMDERSDDQHKPAPLPEGARPRRTGGSSNTTAAARESSKAIEPISPTLPNTVIPAPPSSYRQFMNDLDALAERISLRNKFPGYFSKWIFRGALLLLAALFGVAAWEQGFNFSPQLYMECPKDAFMGKCANPLYDPYGTCLENPLATPALCNKEFLLAGETYGKKPSSFIANNWFSIVAATVAGAFLLNHLLFVRRSGRWLY